MTVPSLELLTRVVNECIFGGSGAGVSDKQLVVDPARGPAVAQVLEVDLGFV